jgi:TatD DNase family protein
VDLPAPLPLFDTHAHLDFERFEPDFEEVLARARAAGVERLVTIGASGPFEANRRALALAERYDHIWATVGIHPHEARIATDAYLEAIETWAVTHPRVVAVGETGLDYHYDRSPRDVQRAVFERFVALARRVDKPLVVHTREAEAETITILSDGGARDCGGILHCFSGTAWLAERALELDFYLSFSGIVTYRSAAEVREVARQAPLDRILVETDAPYLAPVPLRGQRNEPAFVNHTARVVAELRGMDPHELATATTTNALRLFRLDGRAPGSLGTAHG